LSAYRTVTALPRDPPAICPRMPDGKRSPRPAGGEGAAGPFWRVSAPLPSSATTEVADERSREDFRADYALRPSELSQVLALLVEARQPTIVFGPPGAAKSPIAQQVAAATNRQYVNVRALMLDPLDLRGIPWRNTDDRTRWAPPAFLSSSNDPGRWLINLEDLPSAVPMDQAALYQLVLDRKVGEYELPEGASLIASGNRESDRGVVHRRPTPLASRFVHLDIGVDAED